MGAITAVAVWNHQPSASELLDARFARGWKPTPSDLRDGERILGYAACAVTQTPHRGNLEPRAEP